MKIDVALNKLNSLLPLKERQSALKSELKLLHQEILCSFANSGRAPKLVDKKMQLKALAENDLIVLDKDTNEISGAYPFSLKKTAHHVFLENADLYAMCAFDAISIAPVFNVSTTVKSHCHISNEKIEIHQSGDKVQSVKPSKDIYIGIKWQQTGSCAAESLCMEMVFLKDKEVAIGWMESDENISVFPLDDAIKFAVNYFKPLIE